MSLSFLSESKQMSILQILRHRPWVSLTQDIPLLGQLYFFADRPAVVAAAQIAHAPVPSGHHDKHMLRVPEQRCGVDQPGGGEHQPLPGVVVTDGPPGDPRWTAGRLYSLS